LLHLWPNIYIRELLSLIEFKRFVQLFGSLRVYVQILPLLQCKRAPTGQLLVEAGVPQHRDRLHLVSFACCYDYLLRELRFLVRHPEQELYGLTLGLGWCSRITSRVVLSDCSCLNRR
jgi:hypothetical protein